MAALQELMDQPNVNVDQAMPFGVRALAGQHDLPDTFLHRGEFTLFCKYNDNSKDSNAITSGCATNVRHAHLHREGSTEGGLETDRADLLWCHVLSCNSMR